MAKTRKIVLKRSNLGRFRFTVADLSDFICEFTRDGKRKTNRDVLQWYRWFERKCGFKESHIFKVLKGGRRVYKKL